MTTAKRRSWTKRELIRAVNADPVLQKRFDDSCGAPGRTIETYLDEYSYREGIVDGLASDMDLLDDSPAPKKKPKPKKGEPRPISQASHRKGARILAYCEAAESRAGWQEMEWDEKGKHWWSVIDHPWQNASPSPTYFLPAPKRPAGARK